MKTTKKTYGVSGLIEFHAIIMCGRTKVTVPFTGGSLSGYGVTPALYTTEDPVMQAIIERSDYFKSGKIVLMREMPGTGKYEQRCPAGDAAGTRLSSDASLAAGQAVTAGMVMETALNPAGEPQGTGAAVPKSAQDADDVRVVEVTDIDDARDYLCEEFGVARSSIRSNASVLRCADEHKIKFSGLD